MAPPGSDSGVARGYALRARRAQGTDLQTPAVHPTRSHLSIPTVRRFVVIWEVTVSGVSNSLVATILGSSQRSFLTTAGCL